MEDWELHLTTLFPEVRPRRYFELRSADTIPPEYLAAPIAFIAGLVYDEATSVAAAGILDLPEIGLLETAGRAGLGDSTIRERSVQLVDLALAGCRSLDPSYLSKADLASAADFFDRYTCQGQSPGDDWN
jgi:Gamma-glutamylcysteine synthetase